jgi:hypothetical protein
MYGKIIVVRQDYTLSIIRISYSRFKVKLDNIKILKK